MLIFASWNCIILCYDDNAFFVNELKSGSYSSRYRRFLVVISAYNQLLVGKYITRGTLRPPRVSHSFCSWFVRKIHSSSFIRVSHMQLDAIVPKQMLLFQSTGEIVVKWLNIHRVRNFFSRIAYFKHLDERLLIAINGSSSSQKLFSRVLSFES